MIIGIGVNDTRLVGTQAGAINTTIIMRHYGFKEISIRGRLAYGAFCLENTLHHLGLQHELLEKMVLPRIWEFTSSSELDKWDDSIREVDPDCIVDETEEHSSLKELYQSLPPFLVEMISDVIAIGTENLYVGTGEYSKHTLKPLLNIIKLCKRHGIPLPAIERFTKSSFKEAHGWGLKIEKDFFK